MKQCAPQVCKCNETQHGAVYLQFYRSLKFFQIPEIPIIRLNLRV